MFEHQSNAPTQKIEQHVTRTVTQKNSKYAFKREHCSKNNGKEGKKNYVAEQQRAPAVEEQLVSYRDLIEQPRMVW